MSKLKNEFKNVKILNLKIVKFEYFFFYVNLNIFKFKMFLIFTHKRLLCNKHTASFKTQNKLPILIWIIVFYPSKKPGSEIGRIVTSQFPLNIPLTCVISIYNEGGVSEKTHVSTSITRAILLLWK